MNELQKHSLEEWSMGDRRDVLLLHGDTVGHRTFAALSQGDYDATEFNCAMARLDELGVPRQDEQGRPYSIVGRVNLLWKRVIRAESDLETIALRHNIIP